MNRHAWSSLVLGALFLVPTGCQDLNLGGAFALESDMAGKERTVSGSLEAVAQSTQASLRQASLNTVLTREGESIYLKGQTTAGAKFKIVLTRDKTTGEERTRVRLDWDGLKDDQTAFQILAQIGISNNSK